MAQTDPVIVRVEDAVKQQRAKLIAAKRRMAAVQARVMRPDGSTRPGAAAECAARQQEISAMEARLSELEASAAHAREDLPRREAERKRAGEVDAEVAEADRKISRLKDQIDTAQRLRADRIAAADAHRRSAAKTQNELAA